MNESESVNRNPSADPAETSAEPERKTRPKPKTRRAYLDDIRRGADGSYIYTGVCYAYDEAVNPRGSVLTRLWVLTALSLCACIAGGFMDAPFLRDTWYVIAPLAFEIVSVGSAVWAVCRVTANGNVMRGYVRRQTFGALPVRCGLAIAFSALGLIGAAVYMILYGGAAVTLSGVAYLVLKAANIVFCTLILRFSRAVVWKETGKRV